MGVIMRNCCQSEHSNTEFITSSSINENLYLDENLLNRIPKLKDSNQGINYIISKECYQILIRKVPKVTFLKKLCQNLSIQELFIFVKKSINWILLAKNEKNEKIIIKYLTMIKDYVNYGTKKIINDLSDVTFEQEDENYLIQSLSDFIMLIELIMFMNKSSEYNNIGTDFSCRNVSTEYDINLWYNKNISEVIRKYCFDGCYFLLNLKLKYKCENKYNNTKFIQTPNYTKINNETKNEVKKLFYLIEDFIKEISKLN